MPSKDLYILLRAKDMASKTIKGVSKSVGGLQTAGARAGAALKTMAVGAAAIGTTVLVANVKSGIDSLAELESATTSVQGALEQMGLAGQITGKQVADWANEIEAATDAAFDDKAITRATTTLVRYGNVAPKNLRKTMEVMTDLAAKTGDVESASTLLAKALADPAKAAGKLSRVGIVLTKTQQDQIKAMVKAGDAAGAQALLLDILAQKTTGAAKAMSGPYQDAMAKLGDAVEDAQRALAIGFLPVIQEVADWLSKELVKPSTIQGIKDFGQGLAGGLREAVKWARSLPWDQIVSGLKSAAGFAKTLIDAFMAMPTEVKGLIIGLAGLNKLTGGAVGGIVSELGKGLIHGVLGMNAGVVNINAAVVNGGGLPGGGAGAVGAKGGGIVSGIKSAATYILPFLPAAFAIGASEAIRQERLAEIASKSDAELVAMRGELANVVPGFGAIGARWSQQNAQQLASINAELGRRGIAVEGSIGRMGSAVAGQLDSANALLTMVRDGNTNLAIGLGATKTALGTAIGAVNAAVGASQSGITSAVNSDRSATTSALAGVKSATASGLSGVRSAVATDTAVLRAKNFTPRIFVNNNISVRSYMNGQVVVDAYTNKKRAP